MGCGSSHAQSYDELQAEFEKKHMAWSSVKLDDYSARLKKNVQEDFLHVSIAQLKESMKGADSFNELAKEHSVVRQQMNSRYLQNEPQTALDDTRKVGLRNLALVGVLFCDGNKESRAKNFADIALTSDEVAKDDQEIISAYH